MTTCCSRKSSAALLLSSLQILSIITSTTSFSWSPIAIDHPRQLNQFSIQKQSYSKRRNGWFLNVASDGIADTTATSSAGDRDRLERLAKVANDALTEH